MDDLEGTSRAHYERLPIKVIPAAGGANVRPGVLCARELRDGAVEEKREAWVEVLFAERNDWLCEA
ncbi:hypothetical protein glysoja_020597 [Glycine soja]|nr:hypothetical protein glysoja_020597 [Glycine soja]